MEHLLHLLHRNALLHRLYDFVAGASLDRGYEIVPDLKSVENVQLFLVRSVKAQVRLRQPFWQVEGERIAV